MSDCELLTAKELAPHLKVSQRTVRAWAAAGIIPSVRVTPRVVRFRLGDVLTALCGRSTKANPIKAGK